MKSIKFSEIEWKTDGEEVELPDAVILEVADDFDVDACGADLLSDKYGWLVESFIWEFPAMATNRRKQC